MPLLCHALSRSKGQLHFLSVVDEEMNICRNHHNSMNIINAICLYYLHNQICRVFAVLCFNGSRYSFDPGAADKIKYGLIQLC